MCYMLNVKKNRKSHTETLTSKSMWFRYSLVGVALSASKQECYQEWKEGRVSNYISTMVVEFKEIQ